MLLESVGVMGEQTRRSIVHQGESGADDWPKLDEAMIHGEKASSTPPW